MIRIQNIMVPVDFSEKSLYAARYAVSLAQAHKAKLYMLHVIEPYPVHGRIVAGSLEDVQNHRIQTAKNRLSGLIPVEIKSTIAAEQLQIAGTPVQRVIVEKARQLKVDVIVMAAHSRRGLMRFFKKNILDQVIRNAPCSVFAVRCPQGPHKLRNNAER